MASSRRWYLLVISASLLVIIAAACQPDDYQHAYDAFVNQLQEIMVTPSPPDSEEEEQLEPTAPELLVGDDLPSAAPPAALTDADFPTTDPVPADQLPKGFTPEELLLLPDFLHYRRTAFRGFAAADGWDRWLYQVFWNEELAEGEEDVAERIAEWYVIQLTAADVPGVTAEMADDFGVLVRFGAAPDDSFSQGLVIIGPPHTPYATPVIGDYAAGLRIELDRRPPLITPARELLDAHEIWDALPRPYLYARVLNPLPVVDAAGSERVVRTLPSMATWVSVREAVTLGDQTWYRIGVNEYVNAAGVALFTPSGFRGVKLDARLPGTVGFVYKDALNVRGRPGASDGNPLVDQLRRYDLVVVYAEAAAPDGIWYQTGPDRWVHGDLVRLVRPTPRPEPVGPDEKWINVDLSEQTVAAYEGDRLVYATLASTGMRWTPTVQGLFRIWAKMETGRMSLGSLERGDFYYLPDVPYIMYFHGNYALHGAYWHDGFGTPRSRGCVNLSPWDARWFFEWTTPAILAGHRAVLTEKAPEAGTWVNVR